MKILTLGFICFFVFAYCESPADPEIEKVLVPVPATPTPNQWPSIIYFKAEPPEILLGESSTISWKVTNAYKVTITPAPNDQNQTSVPSEGSGIVSPEKTTTYDMWAYSSAGYQRFDFIIILVWQPEESTGSFHKNSKD